MRKFRKNKKFFGKTQAFSRLNQRFPGRLFLLREAPGPDLVLRIVRAEREDRVGEWLAVLVAGMNTNEKHPVRFALNRVIFNFHEFSLGKNE